jgi:hypothetical protein
VTRQGLFVKALLFSALAVACDRPVLRGTWRGVERDLARAAHAGHPARLIYVPGDPDAEARRLGPEALGRETLLIVSPQSISIVPAARAGVLTTEEAKRAYIQRWVEPFLKAADTDGAVRSAARGFLQTLEDEGLARRLPPSVPIGTPNEWGHSFPSRNFDWGLPVALVVALVLARLKVAAQRSDHDRSRRPSSK